MKYKQIAQGAKGHDMKRTLEQVLQEEFNGMAYDDLKSVYDDFLDEAYGDVTVAGMEFSTSSLLKDADPTAYRCGMSDWSSEDYQEFDDLYYTNDDVAEAQETVDNEEEEDAVDMFEDSDIYEGDGYTLTRFILPEHWADSLINGDDTGLSVEDERAIKDMDFGEGAGYCVSVSDESFFSPSPDYGMAGYCLYYVFRKDTK